MRFLVILFITFVSGFVCRAQTETITSEARFRVERNGDRIGFLSISCKRDGERVTYSLTSDVSVEFLFDIDIEERIVDVFESGSLFSSSHKRFVNGVLKSEHSVHREPEGYRAMDRHDDLNVLEGDITCTVLSIYFQEPEDGERAYSHNYRRMLRLESSGAHRYVVELPNGLTTRYSYREGLLQEVESGNYLGTVRFVREEL